jgi:hypothetical protein
MTPKSAWEAIKDYIPKNKIIWEAFYGNGDSGKYLEELGFNTIHENVDFYENNLGDIIVSNPPFSDCKQIMERLSQLDKPFILIMPSSKINTSYFRNNFMNKKIQIMIPKKRIQFIKLVNGKIPDDYKSGCNFDCFYYCYKIGLKNDITWLS